MHALHLATSSPFASNNLFLLLCLAIILLIVFFILRKITHLFITTIIFIISAACAFYIRHKIPDYFPNLLDNPSKIISYGLPALAFLVTFYILRKISNIFFHPFETSYKKSEFAQKSQPYSFFKTLFTIVPTLALGLFIITIIHHICAIDAIKNYLQNPKTKNNISVSQKTYTTIEKIVPDFILSSLTPSTSPTRIKIARYITSYSQNSPTPEINPDTGKPYPRAIIVPDEELQKIASDGKIESLLHHPNFAKIANNPTVIAAFKKLQ